MSYSETTKNNFRENKLLSKWARGEATLNGWLAIPSACSAEAMAHAGWDSLTLDMQHGLIDYPAALNMLMAISTTDVVPMVRVPWLDEGIIMKMLDAGAYGIICPMINTKEDAQRFAKSCKYAPQGSRSFGPIRANLYAGSTYWQHANKETVAIAMIETQEALDNLDSILDVEEIQAVYIGPADLSLALGATPGFDPGEKIVVEAMKHIVETARAKGKWVGVHNGTVEYACKMVNTGANFVTVGSDMRLMTAGAHQVVNTFKEKNK